MKHRLLFAILLAGGCTESPVAPDAGGLDGGSSEMDAGGERAPCGAVSCDPGQVCCNESCGTCVMPGEGCSPTECTPDAGPPDAGPAACEFDEDCAFGVWCCYGCDDTSFCSDGEFCPDILCPEPCEADGTVCGAGEYCDYADEDVCFGYGECVPIPTDCTDESPAVCGCDFYDYANECEAAAAGTDIEFEGACDDAFCRAMDAASEGDCESIAGYAWDGADCQVINCSCTGVDCDWIFSTYEDCLDDFWDCMGEFCGGFTGEVCASGEFCDYRDRDMCGAADGSGVCRVLPTTCAGEPSSPVCGCDGTTYDNDCLAHVAGTDVYTRTACGADCRTAVCPEDYYCTECEVGMWRCLGPDEFCAF